MKMTEGSTPCEGKNCTKTGYVFFQTKNLCLGCYEIKLKELTDKEEELRVVCTKWIKNRTFDIRVKRYRNIFTGKFQKK